MATLPHEFLIADVVYPGVQLVYGHALSMLPAIGGHLQGGL